MVTRKHMDAGTIAGIVIASIALIVVLFLLWRMQKTGSRTVSYVQSDVMGDTIRDEDASLWVVRPTPKVYGTSLREDLAGADAPSHWT